MTKRKPSLPKFLKKGWGGFPRIKKTDKGGAPPPDCIKGRWSSFDCKECGSISKVDQYCPWFPLVPLIESPPKGIPENWFELKIPYFRIGPLWCFVFRIGREYKVTPIYPDRSKPGAIFIKFSEKINLRKFCAMMLLGGSKRKREYNRTTAKIQNGDENPI